MILRVLSASLLFWALNLVTSATPASADFYAQCDGPDMFSCAPDSSQHVWCFGDSMVGANRAAVRASAQWAIENLAAQTEMSELKWTNDQCSNLADVRFRWSTSIGAGVAGQYSCNANPNPPRVCSDADVTFNTDAMSTCQLDTQCPRSNGNAETGELDHVRDKTACHEVGHSVGFDHHPDFDWYEPPGDDFENDCQISGWLDSGQIGQGWLRYNGHHVDHINAEFP